MRDQFMKFLTDNFSQLYNCGIPLQDIVALSFNLRPLVRIGVSSQQLKVLREICPELGLRLLAMSSYGPNLKNPLLLISKSEKKLKEYYRLEEKYIKKEVDSLITGQYLGYHPCCVKKYKKNLKINKDNPIKTLLNTKGKLDFRLNYLYNMDSRQLNYLEFKRISQGYHLSNMYLIPHIPCSFNCRNSVEYAKKLSNILKLYFPKYYEKIIFFLKRPILYFNNSVFFPLIGKVNNNSLAYRSIIKIHNNLPSRILKLLKKGNLIKEENNSFQIYRGNCYINKLPSGVKLFNFE